jgi:hypothetical protein
MMQILEAIGRTPSAKMRLMQTQVFLLLMQRLQQIFAREGWWSMPLSQSPVYQIDGF